MAKAIFNTSKALILSSTSGSTLASTISRWWSGPATTRNARKSTNSCLQHSSRIQDHEPNQVLARALHLGQADSLGNLELLTSLDPQHAAQMMCLFANNLHVTGRDGIDKEAAALCRLLYATGAVERNF